MTSLQPTPTTYRRSNSTSSTVTARESNSPPNQAVNNTKPPQKPTEDKEKEKEKEEEENEKLPSDIRFYLPCGIRRFTGWRSTPKPPFEPLPFPPFSWLTKIPIAYESYIWATIGSFVGIALIEIVMIRAFHDTPGNMLIIAAFGAGAVLVYSQFESPLAQPRNIIGGSAISCFISVAFTKLFKLSGNYDAAATLNGQELSTLVWVNGALSMSIALLAMQLTGTTHPPGGAAALIGATQVGAIRMGWRYIYVVMVSACLELGWALLWNNLGRRRYPTYWISPGSQLGTRVFNSLRKSPVLEADENAPVYEKTRRRVLINTEERIGMGEGSGLNPDSERRLLEQGVYKPAPKAT